MTKTNNNFLSEDLLNNIRNEFCYLERDYRDNERLFFENSGGSLRLKSVVDAQAEITAIPDCPERSHDTALYIRNIINQGKNDVRLFMNAKDGVIVSSLTASKLMFEIVTTIAATVEHKNIVTTEIEHPSSYDACEYSSHHYHHDLRIAKADPKSGSVPLENILNLVDENTLLVSVILTSNITGAMHDIKHYANEIKKKNPQTLIVVDDVQAAPHRILDINSWKIDALNIAPYKMFGNRGVSFAYLSNPVASMPHHRLLATDNHNWDIGSPTPANFSAFSKIVNYICSIGKHYHSSQDKRALIEEGMNRIHKQEQALLNRLIQGTTEVTGIKDLQNVTVHFEEANGENQDLILALTFDN